MQIIRVNLESGILTVRKLWKVNRKIKRILLQLNKLTLERIKESINLELVTSILPELHTHH